MLYLNIYTKKYLVSILLIYCLFACESSVNDDDNIFTNREISYPLYQGSEYDISGDVTFKEMKDQSTMIILNLSGTENGLFHPVHLHYDNIAGNGEIAAVLNPVEGKSGESTTTLATLDNNSKITYHQLLEMEASIKIHLSNTEPGKHIILAGGNIGVSDSKSDPFGRFEISICNSN